MKYFYSGLAMAVLAASVTGCNRSDADAENTGSLDGATAASLGEVSVVRLNANDCEGGISAGLGERGFSVIQGGEEADAVLEVSIDHTGRNMDDVPSFGGVGNEARYTATLHGADEKVLFSTSGNEGSINVAELCGDIGDEIGDRMEEQKYG